MVSIKTPIVLGGIALALIVLFLSINKFGIPTFEKLGKTTGGFLSDASKGFTDFFNSLETGQTEEQKATQEAQDIFDRQIEEKEQQSIDAGFDSVEDFEQAGDPNSIFNASLDELTKFNPAGIIGFGIAGLNEGKGIQDNSQNRASLFDIIQNAGDRGIFNVNEIDFSNVSITSSQAFGGTDATQIERVERRDFIRELDGSKKPKPQGTTQIEGTVRSEIDSDQEFKVFSSDSSRPVIGVIRKTRRNPRRLRVNSKNRPTETASQRANRVFTEQGVFAGEGRGFRITKASVKARNFNFGTNTGSSLKRPTSGKSARLRLADRKRIASEKAKQIFDGGSISNF